MKEFTVTMNAQITYILKESELATEERLRGILEKAMAMVIKEDVDADDVVVSDMKLFILDKKEEDAPNE